MSNPTRRHLLVLGRSMALISAITIVGYLVVQAQRSSQAETPVAPPPATDALAIQGSQPFVVLGPDGAPMDLYSVIGSTPAGKPFLPSSKSGIVAPVNPGSEESPTFLFSSKSLSPEALKALEAKQPADAKPGADDPEAPPAASDADG